jgi:hypothetical protein
MKQHEPGTYKTPESKCLNCGKVMDRASNPDGDHGPPEEGCLTLCIRCGAVMAFDRNLGLRGLTDQEIDEITSDPDYMLHLGKMARAIQFIRHAAN